MRGKSFIGAATLGLVLSAGLLVPAGAAAPTGTVSVSFKGLIASAEGMTEQGGHLFVQGMEDAWDMFREPGSKPVKQEAPISGLVAISVEGPFADPDVLAREVWCVAEDDDAFTMDRKLTWASLEFTCDAVILEVICTEWVDDECVMGEEMLNEELTETLDVAVEWTGVGGIMRDMSVNRSSGDDFWWLSHTRVIHRAAIATGTVVGQTTGTIFDGEFEYADLANVRDGSIQRGDMEW